MYEITPDNIKNLGPVLWNIRTTQRVTQKQLADKLMVYQSHISSLECDKEEKKKVPSLPGLVKYLDALGFKLIIEKK